MNKETERAHHEKQDQARHSSQLFLLRVWLGETNEGQQELQGRLQHTATGVAHYFRSGSELADILRRMIPPRKTDQDGKVENDLE